jgi:hypothetical protein
MYICVRRGIVLASVSTVFLLDWMWKCFDIVVCFVSDFMLSRNASK